MFIKVLFRSGSVGQNAAAKNGNFDASAELKVGKCVLKADSAQKESHT